MRKRLFCALLSLAAIVTNAIEPTTEKLPVRRVVLYKNGVGYFEHTGRVTGNQELKIDFTSSQLNDVLKSLTVLDLNGGRISRVGYNSVAPISEQLKSLGPPPRNVVAEKTRPPESPASTTDDPSGGG